MSAVRTYARSLAARVGRLGLIELGPGEFTLTRFEAADGDTCEQGPFTADEPTGTEAARIDPRGIAEAIEEMNWDVAQWLLAAPPPRTPEARALLREVADWVLLGTCDHDGVVASYRMLKGHSDIEAPDGPYRPRIKLVLLDAHDEAEAGRVFHKLAGVCSQFLDWAIEPSPVCASDDGDTDAVSEHIVLNMRASRDKAQVALAGHWNVVSEFLARAKASAAAREAAAAAAASAEAALAPQPDAAAPAPPGVPEIVAVDSTPEPLMPANVPLSAAEPANAPAMRIVRDTAAPAFEQFTATPFGAPVAPEPLAAAPAASISPAHQSDSEVLDLPSADASADMILAAVLGRPGSVLVECPLRPPMSPSTRLAVARDRTMTLVAVAPHGLGELKCIGQAYRWASENLCLIGMAVPQFAIDIHQRPRLQLLVDHADVAADILQPILQAEHVSVRAYRKLRWGGKTGLLLDAA